MYVLCGFANDLDTKNDWKKKEVISKSPDFTNATYNEERIKSRKICFTQGMLYMLNDDSPEKKKQKQNNNKSHTHTKTPTTYNLKEADKD